MHPFRFGVYGWAARDAEGWQALARRAEELGYASFVMPDHLGGQLSPIASLAAAATSTSRVAIGAWVFANDFRHPLILAREAAALDILSNGRLELGLGAGWRVADYRSLGKPYESAGRRIDRLEEAIGIIKRLLSGERVNHAGANYELRGATVGQRPIQRPHPRLAIGGGGPRILRLAAREADIVGIHPRFNARGRPTIGEATDAATERKAALLREAAGERFERLELSVWVADAELVAARHPLAAVSAAVKSVPAGIVGGSPYVLYGTRNGLREQLLRRRERAGISYYMWPARCMEAMSPLVAELAGR